MPDFPVLERALQHPKLSMAVEVGLDSSPPKKVEWTHIAENERFRVTYFEFDGKPRVQLDLAKYRQKKDGPGDEPECQADDAALKPVQKKERGYSLKFWSEDPADFKARGIKGRTIRNLTPEQVAGVRTLVSVFANVRPGVFSLPKKTEKKAFAHALKARAHVLSLLTAFASG